MRYTPIAYRTREVELDPLELSFDIRNDPFGQTSSIHRRKLPYQGQSLFQGYIVAHR